MNNSIIKETTVTDTELGTHPFYVSVETNFGSITWCLNSELEFHTDGYSDTDISLVDDDILDTTAAAAEEAVAKYLKN